MTKHQKSLRNLYEIREDAGLLELWHVVRSQDTRCTYRLYCTFRIEDAIEGVLEDFNVFCPG